MATLQFNIIVNDDQFGLLRQAVVDNINYSKLAEEVDVGAVASDVAREIDLRDLSDNINISDLAEYVDTDSVAEAMAADDRILKAVIDRAASALAESVKVNLEKEVASKLLSKEICYKTLAGEIVQEVRRLC